MSGFIEPGNQALLDELVRLREDVALAKAEPPDPPARWYLYSSIDTVYSVLASLDRRGIEVAPFVHGRVVADLGCADGELAFWVERAGAARVVAVDSTIVNPRVDLAVQTLRRRLGSRISFVDADVLAWCERRKASGPDAEIKVGHSDRRRLGGCDDRSDGLLKVN